MLGRPKASALTHNKNAPLSAGPAETSFSADPLRVPTNTNDNASSHHNNKRLLRKSSSNKKSHSHSHHSTSATTMTRAFYAWILCGACLMVLLQLVRQTRQVVRLSRKHFYALEASFLAPPKPKTNFEQDYLEWLQQKKEKSSNVTETSGGDRPLDNNNNNNNNNIDDEDDEFMDDDNQFNDDDTYEDLSTEDAGNMDLSLPQTLEDSTAIQNSNNNNKDDNAKNKQIAAIEAKLKALRQKAQARNQGQVEEEGETLSDKQERHGQLLRQRQRERMEESSIKHLLLSEAFDNHQNNEQAEAAPATIAQWRHPGHDSPQNIELQEKRVMQQNAKFRKWRHHKENGLPLAPIVLNWKPPNWNTTDYTNYPPLPLDDKILPDMTTFKGGIIFFLHVPKTGGQTIRQFNLRFRRNVHAKERRRQRFAAAAQGGDLFHARRRRRETRPGGRQVFPQRNKDALQRRLQEMNVAVHYDKNNDNDDDSGGDGEEEEEQNEDPDTDTEIENGNDEDAASSLAAKKTSSAGRGIDIVGTNAEQNELFRLTRDKLRFVAANTLDVFQAEVVPQVNFYLSQAKNGVERDKILFVEVHGMDNYHAHELEPYLHYWREEAKKYGVPFFAFTLLREAISLQISFFNYYYIHPADPRFCRNPLKPTVKCGVNTKAKQKQAKLERAKLRGQLLRLREQIKREGDQVPELLKTQFREMEMEFQNGSPFQGQNHAGGIPGVSHEELEKAMLEVAYKNPQCLFLARGERTFGDEGEAPELRTRTPLTRKDCQETYMSLQRTMDWIGRTDTLDTETLPLLTHIMFGKPILGKHVPKVNVSPTQGGYVKRSKISDATQKALERVSQLDQELYHRAKEDYTLDMWVNATDYS